MSEHGRWQVARASLRSRGTTVVLVGSAMAGLGAYVFQVVGTRSLGDEAYAPIGVLWTIQYLSLTVALVSVEAYLTRTITVQGHRPPAVRRALVFLGGWVLGVASLIGIGTWMWREALFHGAGADLPAVAAATVFGYGMLVIVRGQLAGRDRFRAYGIATGAESLLRLAAVLPVALIISTTRSVAWTLPVGTFAVAAWWLLVGRKGGREADPAREPDARTPASIPGASTGRYLLATTTANAASQTLLAAGPLVLIPLGAGAAEISVFFVTITAARVPLVFAFGGVLSRVLPALTRAAQAGEFTRLQRLALTIYGAALLIAAVGAAPGAWIGPQVVALFFGAAFSPPGWFVALTVVGVTLATAALGLNQILIAMGAELRLVAPWLLGLAVGGAAVVFLEGGATLRVASGFTLGQAIALTGLLVALVTARTGRAA